MSVGYRHHRFLWSDYPAQALELASDPGVRRVADVGGGANPMLQLPDVERLGLDYDVVDISTEELAKAPAGYRTVEADVASAGFAGAHGPYDLVLSAFLAEHVRDPRAFHSSLYAALAPGGRALHVFPTLFEPAFVVNRILPERVTGAAVRRLQDLRTEGGQHEKFPAYYRWCRGPTRAQLARLEGLGFEVLDYVGYFGHHYLDKLPVLDRLVQRVSAGLVGRPVAALTSFARVVLRRPDVSR